MKNTRMKTKFLVGMIAVLFAIFLALGGATLFSSRLSANAAGATYSYMGWDSSSNALTSKTIAQSSVKVITSSSLSEDPNYKGRYKMGEENQTTWYIVKGSVTYTEQINVYGTVNLILADGANFTVNANSTGYLAVGVSVEEDCTLNVYGQSAGTGQFNVIGNSWTGFLMSSLNSNNSTLNVHGGKVTSTVRAENENGKGITGDVRLYGGELIATGFNKTDSNSNSGSGIDGDSLYVYGGKLVATGTGTNSYGIKADITMTGGTVEAVGQYIGISNATYNGGITISGGTLTATTLNTDKSYAISAKVYISGGKVFASGVNGISDDVFASGGVLVATGSGGNGITDTVTANGGLVIAKGSGTDEFTRAVRETIVPGEGAIDFGVYSSTDYSSSWENASWNSITLTDNKTDAQYVKVYTKPPKTDVTGVSLNKNSISVTYGAAAQTLSPTVSPSDATDKTVTWSSSNTNVVTVNANGQLTFKNAGTATITVKTNDQNKTATCTITVNKKPVNVTGAKANHKVYDGNTTASFNLSSAQVSGVLTGDKVTVTAASGNFDNKNVGNGKTVTITGFTLGGASVGNYTVSTSTSQKTSSANISKREITISNILANDKVYDGNTAATLSYGSVNFGNKVAGDTLTVQAVGTFDTQLAGENKTVSLSNLTLGGTSIGNYVLAGNGQQTTCTAAIIKAPLTITAKEDSVIYGEKPENDGVTYEGFVNGETEETENVFGVKGIDPETQEEILVGNEVLYSYSYEQYDDAGEYEIIPHSLESVNYAITFVNGKLTVEKRPVTARAENVTALYGVDAELHFTLENMVKDEKLEGLTISKAYGFDAGEYTIFLVHDDTKDLNYDVTTVGAKYTINKREVKVTLKNVSAIYGEEDNITYDVEGALTKEEIAFLQERFGEEAFAEADVLHGLHVTREAGKDVGEYKISAKLDPAQEKNYSVTLAGAGKYIIEPREVTVKVKDATCLYGDEAELTYEAEGLAEGDSLPYLTLTREEGENVGSYKIKAVNDTSKDKNHIVTVENEGTYTIEKREVKVTIHDVTSVYGEEGELTYSVEGLKEGMSLEGFTLVREEGETIGTYKITGKIDEEASKNFEITVENEGTYTINRAKVDVEVEFQKEIVAFEYTGEEIRPEIVVKANGKVVPSNEYEVIYENNVEIGTASVTVKNLGGGNYEVKEKKVTFAIVEKLGVVKVVEPEQPNANHAAAVDSEEEMLEKIDLTETERRAILDGKDVHIYLEVTDISKEVDKEEKKAIEEHAGEEKVAFYLDVSLFVRVEGEEADKITNTKEKITIEFELPEKYQNAPSDRSYYILRSHEGEVEKLRAKVENGMVTFKTDRFSTYALAYTETETECWLTWWWIVIFVLVVVDLIFFIILLVKKNRDKETSRARKK